MGQTPKHTTKSCQSKQKHVPEERHNVLNHAAVAVLGYTCISTISGRIAASRPPPKKKIVYATSALIKICYIYLAVCVCLGGQANRKVAIAYT